MNGNARHRIACIHQPDFAPWLGFFDRLRCADILVVFDNVQYLRRGWQNRDKIKTATGAQWLTVPVRQKGQYHSLIREIEIDNDTDWKRRHLNSLGVNYKRAPYFASEFPDIERIYGLEASLLVDFNMALITHFLALLKIDVQIVMASTLQAAGSKNDLLIGLVKAVGADRYITGTGSRSYLDEAAFRKNGVEVLWQDFKHPIYTQQFGAFVPGLSSLDALFNCGREACVQLLNQTGQAADRLDKESLQDA